jgi:hypothetical protein
MKMCGTNPGKIKHAKGSVAGGNSEMKLKKREHQMLLTTGASHGIG